METFRRRPPPYLSAAITEPDSVAVPNIGDGNERGAVGIGNDDLLGLWSGQQDEPTFCAGSRIDVDNRLPVAIEAVYLNNA